MFQKKSSLKPRDVRVLGVHVFDARLRAECVHLGVTFIGVEGGSCLHAPKRTVLILYVMHPLVKQSSIVFTFLAWPIRRSCCAPRNTTQRYGSRFRVLPMTLFYSVRHPPSCRFLLKNKHAEEAPSHIWPPQKRLVFTPRARVRGVRCVPTVWPDVEYATGRPRTGASARVRRSEHYCFNRRMHYI